MNVLKKNIVNIFLCTVLTYANHAPEHAVLIAQLQQSLSQEPDNVDIHYQLAHIYKENEEFHKAVEHYRHALDLQPYNAKIVVELANALNMFEDTADECSALYHRALELEPGMPKALYNLAYTLKKQGNIKEALTLYDCILQQCPDYALAHFGRGITYLMLGDWQRGWPEYEWRWKAYDTLPKHFAQSVWDGSSLAGKRILVYAEQGLGDSLQFGRYLKLLKEQGAYVIFIAQKPLKKLFALCPYIDYVGEHGAAFPPFDCYIPLMSLPLLCKTQIETVPCDIPYMYADPTLVTYWKEQLAGDTNVKVGLCWQGNANYKTAFLRQVVAAKSVNVNTFAPLAHVPGVTFYSLQMIFGTDQLQDLSTGFVVQSFGADFDESHGRFMDTAAVMKNLDIVISVDTSICHLAGALGIEVWVILPYAADWRWMLHRTDTPWYPTMHLFRQEKAGQWGPVIEDIAQKLRDRYMRLTENNKVSPLRHPELVSGSSIEVTFQEGNSLTQ